MAEAKTGASKTKKKESRETASDRMASFMASDTAAKIKKKFGNKSIAVAAEVEEPVIRRIPWNIFGLDYATGGGVPAGRVSLIWGATSSGKTTGILKVLANAQHMCANCYAPFNPITGEIGCVCGEYRAPLAAMINAEGTWDKGWAQRLGVDTNQLIYNEAEYAEQAIDIAETLLRGGDVDIVLVDSIAALTPTAEIEESAEKVIPGGQARLINRAMRTFNSAMNSVGQERGRKPTLILVNQLRQKIGVMYGSPDTMPGGMGQEFAAALVMKFWGGKYELDSDTGKPLYADFKFRVDKNKNGPPKMEGEYRLMLSDTETKKMGDTYDESTIMKLADKVGYLTGSGQKWTMGDTTFKAKSLVERELLTNPEFSYKVRKELLEILQAL